MIDAKTQKKNIRKHILEQRNRLSETSLKHAGEKLSDILSGTDTYKNAVTLLAYASYGSEISTHSIINRALAESKKVYLPKVIEKDIVFYRINSLEELIEGYKGIPEPIGDSERFIYDDSNDKAMILMPGLAFDNDGNRIGYGGGFYDRFLIDKPKLLSHSIAFGFDFQKVDFIPAEYFDIKPDKIVYIDSEG